MHDIMVLGMGIDAWITLATMFGVFLTLLLTNTKAHVAFFCAIAALNVTGVMTIEEAFSGFDTSSIITVGLLFLVISGLRHTGALEWMVSHLMGQPKSYPRAIIRLMLPVGILSSFMSNTGTTALFQDVIKKWAGKLGMAPSKLLIPLAYAASLGGLLTLIGTPPNLIIAGVYAKNTGVTMNTFAPFPIAICCLLASITIVVLLRNLLPTRMPAEAEAGVCSESGSDVCSQSGSALSAEHEPEEPAALANAKASGKTYLSIAIMISVLALSALNILSLSSCCILAGILMVITKCCTSEQATKEVDWTVLMVFAGSICIGNAIHKTGIDEMILHKIFAACGSDPVMVLLLLSATAAVMTEFISDTACAAMFCPIGMQAASYMGIDPLPFVIALMMAVSNNYSTPIATPPNTLVYMSGGYKFSDFARLGLILKVVNLVIAVSLASLML